MGILQDKACLQYSLIHQNLWQGHHGIASHTTVTWQYETCNWTVNEVYNQALSYLSGNQNEEHNLKHSDIPQFVITEEKES